MANPAKAVSVRSSHIHVSAGSVRRIGKVLRENRMTLILKSIRKSRKAEKKYDAVFERDGREKVVSFGAAGMSNYTKHKNATRKQRYLKRHTGKGENWRKPDTPGALSRWILWNKPSFRESVADYKRRFGL